MELLLTRVICRRGPAHTQQGELEPRGGGEAARKDRQAACLRTDPPFLFRPAALLPQRPPLRAGDASGSLCREPRARRSRRARRGRLPGAGHLQGQGQVVKAAMWQPSARQDRGPRPQAPHSATSLLPGTRPMWSGLEPEGGGCSRSPSLHAALAAILGAQLHRRGALPEGL